MTSPGEAKRSERTCEEVDPEQLEFRVRRDVEEGPEVHHRGREDTEINVKRIPSIGGVRAPEGGLPKILQDRPGPKRAEKAEQKGRQTAAERTKCRGAMSRHAGK